ncbi:hypothetical protein H490_0101105 [Leucobacter sp. UCD-THU]|jgi:hypothetical protein|uniref:DUF3180 family protein n=1 Tax=Leucobacter muris TaxID=1935379 RepID=A0ABX5QDH6_9MICO|nr:MULTISPECIES: DUF3180 family protein [Leucobacter]EYT56499.1 hypothetical protein H490_0101105 [Leucobacter sp. UCD-THU]QAB17026.1 DUF3180 family protein [Leucobacter muris]
MPRGERSNPAVLAAAAAMGAAAGLLVQFVLSNRGHAPLVPPLSLPLTLVLVAAVLLVFALRLRRALKRGPGAVNPFQAVRLLVASRAAQLVGGMLGGFGGGLALSLLGRSVPAPTATWLPMLLTLAAGAVLTGCALFAEHCCRVPPGDDDADPDTADPAPGRGPADQTAFRG